MGRTFRNMLFPNLVGSSIIQTRNYMLKGSQSESDLQVPFMCRKWHWASISRYFPVYRQHSLRAPLKACCLNLINNFLFEQLIIDKDFCSNPANVQLFTKFPTEYTTCVRNCPKAWKNELGWRFSIGTWWICIVACLCSSWSGILWREVAPSSFLSDMKWAKTSCLGKFTCHNEKHTEWKFTLESV